MSAHRNKLIHWVPPGNWHGQIGEHARTVCDKDIEGPCENHLASGTPCHYGLAWTRSRDLKSYQHRPYESWPPPCPICQKAAALESAS